MTWNPITGCLHNCGYCWARRLAKTRLRRHPHYAKHGFNPAINEKMFRRRFKPNSTVFTVDMGDMWGEWVPENWVKRVLKYIEQFPKTAFFFLTKNPSRYLEFLDIMPRNTILGATIETNRDEGYAEISSAPLPSKRIEAMKALEWPRKVVVIEPVLDFDLEEFSQAIEKIRANDVYIGYDNYRNKLPEPPLEKTKKLVQALGKITNVHTKTLRSAWYEQSTSR